MAGDAASLTNHCIEGMLEMWGVICRLEEGGSLGTFVCMQPVKIFGYDLVQRHIHVCIGMNAGTRWEWGNTACPFEHLENNSLRSENDNEINRQKTRLDRSSR